jgi:hypothetical protein
VQGEAERRDFLGLRLLLPVEPGAALEVQIGGPDAALRGRPAIGATVHITRPDGRVLVGEVDGGNGHSGVRSPELHFGLGDSAAAPVAVVIRYRDREGHALSLELSLEPGWHSVLLPDESASLALARGGVR